MRTFLLPVFTLVLALVPVCSAAQNYHSTAEQIIILEKSKLMYNLGPFTDTLSVEYDTYSQTLIAPGVYVDRSGSGSPLRSYNERFEHEPELLKLHQTAERLFADNELDSARVYYQMLLDRFPENSTTMTYIGQTYALGQQYDEAMQWYSRAIEANPVNYMAHWFIADLYKRREDYDEAMRHITRAHLLNRNNPRILVSLIDIYALNGTPYDPWVFRPIYALRKGEDHHRYISLAMEGDSSAWMGYALCKALWAFEPGYSDSTMAGAHEPPAVVEERECLMSLAAGLMSSDNEVSAVEFRKLLQAVDNKDFDSFLFYEVVLCRNPSLAMLLEPAALESLAEYVAEYHVAKR